MSELFLRAQSKMVDGMDFAAVSTLASPEEGLPMHA